MKYPIKNTMKDVWDGYNPSNGYEPTTTKFCRDTIKSDWTVFDCGAQMGYFTLLFSELCINGRVHSFEPTSTFEILEKNVKFYSEITNVTLNNTAVGNKSGSIEESIYRLWDSKISENGVYNFTTIDDYCSINDITKLDFIKVDVDSFELETLEGASKTLDILKPIIVMELETKALQIKNHSRADIINWMKNKGYNGYELGNEQNFVFKHNSFKG